jgi:hypothetical protein
VTVSKTQDGITPVQVPGPVVLVVAILIGTGLSLGDGVATGVGLGAVLGSGGVVTVGVGSGDVEGLTEGVTTGVGLGAVLGSGGVVTVGVGSGDVEGVVVAIAIPILPALMYIPRLKTIINLLALSSNDDLSIVVSPGLFSSNLFEKYNIS